MLLSLYTRVQVAWLGFRARFEDEDGAVATEYALLLVLVAMCIPPYWVLVAFLLVRRGCGFEIPLAPSGADAGAVPLPEPFVRASGSGTTASVSTRRPHWA